GEIAALVAEGDAFDRDRGGERRQGRQGQGEQRQPYGYEPQGRRGPQRVFNLSRALASLARTALSSASFSRCSSTTSAAALATKASLPSFFSILPLSAVARSISFCKWARSRSTSTWPASDSSTVAPSTTSCTAPFASPPISMAESRARRLISSPCSS